MNKCFIPYEQALALKELGFDEPCFGYYVGKDKEVYMSNETISAPFQFRLESKTTFVAPLYQQAFRWFREKYNLKGHIEAVEYLDGTSDTYHWCIFNKCNSGNDQLTHEEAELECLKKLIEIIKEKNQ